MKIFDLFTTEDVKIEDPGLKRYINLDPKLILKSKGRARRRFEKAKINVIERVISLLQGPGHRGKKHKIMTGRASGKYSKKAMVVIEMLKAIHQKTGQNPVQILIKAIENSAPHDEITVIEYGGARYPQAVDTAPMRRVDMALRNLVHGAYDKAFGKNRTLKDALVAEIVGASNNNISESLAVSKRSETEKMADSAR